MPSNKILLHRHSITIISIFIITIQHYHYSKYRQYLLIYDLSDNVILCVFQPETLTLVLEYSNIIFSALFALEMLLKVLAEGPFGYIQNGFNVFDGFIVILR